MYQQNLNTFEVEDNYTSLGKSLDDDNVRIKFIRKVYVILSFQLLFTTIFCMVSYASPGFAAYQIQNTWLFYLLLIIGFIVEISLVCCKSVARQVPNNYILLGVFTFCQAWIVSYSCSVAYLLYPQNGGQLVLLAAVLTLGVTLSLTLYAFTTKTDFTMMGGGLFVFSSVLLLLGLFAMIFSSPFLYMIYIAGIVISYGLYLIYDTQLLIGKGVQNKNIQEYGFSIDDYIVAALMIYIDIIMLFLELLRILLVCFGKE